MVAAAAAYSVASPWWLAPAAEPREELLGRTRKVRLPSRRRSRSSSGNAMAVAVYPGEAIAEKRTSHTKERRVVVTGMGVETTLGNDPDTFYNNLLEGVSGISEIEAFDCAAYPTRIAGEIKSFSTDGWVAPKLAKRMDKFMLYLLCAGKKALANGGMSEEVMSQLDKAKCGVLIGSAMGGMKVFSDSVEALMVSYRKMNPFCVPFATTNMGSAMLAMDLGWMGPNYSISIACATSNYCILNAANHIIRGEAVTIEDHPHFPGKHASVHPCRHGAMKKKIIDLMLRGVDSKVYRQVPFPVLEIYGLGYSDN